MVNQAQRLVESAWCALLCDYLEGLNMVDEVEFMIMDADERSEPDTCGDCKFYIGEECQGNKYEGSERYDDSEACEDFEPLLNT